MPVWIDGVIQNEGTPKSITILRSCGGMSVEKALIEPQLTQMGVIPESTSLPNRPKIVKERVIRSNRTLRDERRAVSPA